MYRTHTFDYITEALCFLNENNIDKDNIITLTNGGVHWLLVWYEPEQANEETERKFYDIEIQPRGEGIKENLRKTAERFAEDFEYDPPIINFYGNIITCVFYNSPLHRELRCAYSYEDTTDILSFYSYLVALFEKRAKTKSKLNSIYGIMNNPDGIYNDTDSIKVRSDGDGESKQPEDGAEAD